MSLAVSSQTSKAILIVEDNPISRHILCKILEEEHHIIQANNGSDAIKKLTEYGEDIDLIILDIVMPVMDGYTFLATVKKHPIYSSIPVIVTTSNDNEDDEIKALASGAADFIRKPYRRQITKQRVKNIINLRETATLINLIKYDQLTGTYSKEFFYTLVEQTLTENPDKQYDIVCSDIENFSLINDMFSYTVGNDLLRLTASVLKQTFGEEVLCGRISGDTFAFLIERRDDYSKEFFNQPIATLNRLFTRYRLRLDFGIYHLDCSEHSANTGCDRAMSAIEHIKGQFTQNYAIYDDQLHQEKLYAQTIAGSMEKALIDKEFIVHYQPTYDLKQTTLIGAEALVRWHSPVDGLRPPNLFIPLFEQSGFITELDKYVWEEACIFIRQCIDEDIPLVPISVNVSRADLYDPELPNLLLTLVNKYGLNPQHLHLEITESAYTDQPDIIIEMVSKLRNLGFMIEMDDFGTGYSSLNMLSEMPIDILKLDMKFVQNNTTGERSKSILNFIIDLAKWMNLEITAEGVESAAQAKQLREMNCDQAQGYFFSRPLSKEDFILLLREQYEKK